MTNPLKSEASTNTGLFLARIPLGLLFLLLGIAKIRGGVEAFVSHNGGGVPAWANPVWAEHYLRAIPYAEVTVGAMLILGLFTRLAGFAGILLITSFIIGATGLKDRTLPFHPNVVYLSILLLVFLAGPGGYSLDGMMFSKKKSRPFGG